MTPAEDNKSLLQRRKTWWPFIAIPYVIGLLWTCSHPIISVVTGELKCRGWFIDESALDPTNFQMEAPYPQPVMTGDGSSSLCGTLSSKNLRFADNISCIRSTEFDLARIMPLSNALEPTAEALVLVVPAPRNDWLSSPFHISLLHLMNRLSDSQAVPWLSKTVLVVSPSSIRAPLNKTASSFLDAYLSSQSSALLETPVYNSGIIRSLVVLDLVQDQGSRALHELRILPQGRRGLLPNLDFVFASMVVYSRASFLDARQHRDASIVLHPYGESAFKWRKWIHRNIPKRLREWAIELGNMVLFSYTLLTGPYAAHSPALDRGIDAITIEGHLSGQHEKLTSRFIPEFVQQLEYLIHALNNLHERLHHSVTQYVLPSHTKFVSHSEYLLPNILLLLPFVLRAGLLAFEQIGRFHVPAFHVVASALLAVGFLCFFAEHITDTPSVMNTVFAVVYAVILTLSREVFRGEHDEMQTLQFLLCLVAIYVHVPITLAHVSLAYPSALLWTPIAAFPSWSGGETGFIRKAAAGIFLLISWPPFGLILKGYTPYVLFVYTPLHLLLSILLLVDR